MADVKKSPSNALSLPKIEEQILKRWQKEKIFAQTLARKSPQGNFVFYEGPPTANAAPGVHHVLARVFKDIIVRFRTMQGYHVERKAGWDTHGLPVELQVEKQLHLKSKQEIETYGIAKFNAECKKLVWQFKDEWEKLTERIGFWLDLKHPYVTYENDYIESVWAVIAQAHERGLLYQGHKVVPYCPRCGTALSSHEVALGYERIKEKSVYVLFRKLPEDWYFLVWTTTPWTLSANVALAVHPEAKYVMVKTKVGDGEVNVILAKDRLPIVRGEYQKVSEWRGRDLVGWEYQQLQPFLKPDQPAFRVVAGDFVTTTEGTGIVHLAPAFGEDDFHAMEENNLPMLETVDAVGKFKPEITTWAGRLVTDGAVNSEIMAALKREGKVYAEELYEHDYPFCWRCESKLIYQARQSWFIAMTKIKDELLRNAEAINWIPAHIKAGRFGEWIAGVKDWAISRERYWGTPLPVWYCQTVKSKIPNPKSKLPQGCGRWQVMGSVAELKKFAGKVPKDLHRPFVDVVEWPCSKCGVMMTRVPEVLDVWLDSGSMPFAQYHYPFENRELIDRRIRNSTPPAHPPLAKGENGGVQFPADYICEAIDQTRGWFYTLLAVSTVVGKGSSFRNVICLGHINDARGFKMSKSKGNVVDPWEVINRYGVDPLRWYFFTVNQPGEAKNFDPKQIEGVIKKVFLILQNVVSFYQLYGSGAKPSATPPTVTHVLDRWVICRLHQLVRGVTGSLERYEVVDAARPIAEFTTDLSTWYVRRSRDRFKAGDRQACLTLGYVLLQTSKLLAPFTPFFAEWLYQQVDGKAASVHLEDWPTAGVVDEAVLSGMAAARAVAAAALAQRMAAGVKVRQPLAALTGPRLGAELAAIVKDELNVLEYRIGPSVVLQTAVTDALKLRGLARELIRLVNAQRKAAALTVADRIAITVEGDLADVLSAHREDILSKTNAAAITAGTGGTPAQLNDQQIKLRIKKIS